VRLQEATGYKQKRRPLRPPLRNFSQVTHPLQLYEDLYLTEQPYGLVCGVETDLPDND
jgi:hypothetical protein